MIASGHKPFISATRCVLYALECRADAPDPENVIGASYISSNENDAFRVTKSPSRSKLQGLLDRRWGR